MQPNNQHDEEEELQLNLRIQEEIAEESEQMQLQLEIREQIEEENTLQELHEQSFPNMYPKIDAILCKECDGDEAHNEIVREFNAELSKSFNPEYVTDDEVGMLIKIKRLTETYVTLFNRNVEQTQASQSIIAQCLVLIVRIKLRLREICDHIIVEDDIDIDVDRSKHIVYCDRCETTFN
jgi:hypothetical protein